MPSMAAKAFLCLVNLLCLASSSSAQCPNTLAVYNYPLRTTCTNGTYFILPVDQAAVANAVKPYRLLPLPTSDKTLFPNGFPANKHPVVIQSALETDIRMMSLQLQDPLFGGSLVVPYVDRLGDGQTPFRFSVKQYIGGFKKKDGSADSSAVVPTVVGSLGGTPIFVAQFNPNDAAYLLINSSPTEFITQIKKVIVPNPISGPGVIDEAVDTRFSPASISQYTEKLFHQGISQPLILVNGLCQRNPIYFNETFSNPSFRTGKVILYSPGGAFAGVYDNSAGYSAAGPQVGYNAETCQSAAAKTDPKAVN